MSEAKPLRKTSGTAWAWQDKAALRRIREAFDSTNDVSSALATYLALTEIASDAEKQEFTTTHAYIARMSGLSVRTVQSRMAVLAVIGLVEIITPALRAPSTYRLLEFGNGCTTSGNGCRAFGNGQKQAPLPTFEVSSEVSSEEPEKKHAASAACVGFDSFWEAYPKKVAKPAALKAFKKAIQSGATVEAILDGVKRWAGTVDWNKDGGQYVPHPTTFLTQHRWKDTPQAAVTQSAAVGVEFCDGWENKSFWDMTEKEKLQAVRAGNH